MKISELARRAGTTTRALRYYEEQGLLGPRRRPNGYRDYTEQDVRRVANIQYLLHLGFGTADAKTFADCLDGELPAAQACRPAVERARERLADLNERLADLTETRDRLAQLVEAGDQQLAEAV